MKRLKDLFSLPIQKGGLAYINGAEDEVAHAINHVDALADALEKALEIMQGDGMDVYDFFNELSGTLRAYRGEA